MSADALRQTRARFLKALDHAIGSAAASFAFQLDLAREILWAEGQIQAQSGDPVAVEGLQHHISLLRACADGLVWRTLHPHTIRQFAKNGVRPPVLLSQGESFAGVIGAAERLHRSSGVPVIIADLTNIIRIGDLIVVTDPERPMTVEVKARLPEAKRLASGRVGRQLSRIVGTDKYLAEGHAKVFGDNAPRLEIFVDHRAERRWATVEETSRKARASGLAFKRLEKGDYMWVSQASRQDEVFAHIACIYGKDGGPAQFGTSQVGSELASRWPLVAAWPIDVAIKAALLERDLTLYRLVFYTALVGTCEGASVAVEDGEATEPFIVRLDGRELRFPRWPIYDMVYGMETAASARRGLVKFARRIVELGEPPAPPASGAKPGLWVPASKEELEALLQGGEAKDNDLVAIDLEHAEEFGVGGWFTDSGVRGFSIASVEALRERG